MKVAELQVKQFFVLHEEPDALADVFELLSAKYDDLEKDRAKKDKNFWTLEQTWIVRLKIVG